MNDDGVGSALMLALLALAGLLCLATADAANVLISRARAQNAADAAALAAAAAQWPIADDEEEPADVARRIAEANGATLESCACERHSASAVVVVSVPTRIRMLAVAPRHVDARAQADVDAGRVFQPTR